MRFDGCLQKDKVCSFKHLTRLRSSRCIDATWISEVHIAPLIPVPEENCIDATRADRRIKSALPEQERRGEKARFCEFRPRFLRRPH